LALSAPSHRVEDMELRIRALFRTAIALLALFSASAARAIVDAV